MKYLFGIFNGLVILILIHLIDESLFSKIIVGIFLIFYMEYYCFMRKKLK
jgi:hypothetical protein